MIRQPHASAQSNLGHMYAQGHGVPYDRLRAHLWFNLAAANFKDEDLANESRIARENVARTMTRDQIAEAQRLAREWKPKKE